MSPFLPPSTNDQYRGSITSARLLTMLAVLTGVIAGLDLSQCGQVVVALFAWSGATQIVFGIVMLLASLRYRSFVPLVLALRPR